MSSAYELVTKRLGEVTGYQPPRPGGPWRCPAHDDSRPSLSVTDAPDRCLLDCHRGCDVNAVMAALDLPLAALFDDDHARSNGRATEVVAMYNYTDEAGELLFQVCRKSPKGFFQRRPDPKGGWVNNLGRTRRVLYRLPEVLEAVRTGRTIYVTEGEKDADALVRAGEVATTNPAGAGKWRDEHTRSLDGAAQVVVVADTDVPGYRHARVVARALRPHVGVVQVVQAIVGKDISDHLVAEHTVDELGVLADEDLDQACQDEPPDARNRANGGQPGTVAQPLPGRFKSGGAFIFDDDQAQSASVWGRDEEVLWAAGEELLIVSPTGVGKTTLAALLMAARLGIVTEVLGWPVVPSERGVLYLALDRPKQIRRAMRRLFDEDKHRKLLDDRLVVWDHPLPGDLGKTPELLADMADKAKAGTVFIDSVKDAVSEVSDDKAAGNYNRAVQLATDAGIEVAANHHQRKGQGGARPKTIEDVYGSVWIPAGAGSVLLLWGQAGDVVVDLEHLKPPATGVGPLRLEHDTESGRMTAVRREADALVVVQASMPGGVDATGYARVLFETERPNDNQRKKAQRALDRLVAKGLAVKSEWTPGGTGGSGGARYYLAETQRQEEGPYD